MNLRTRAAKWLLVIVVLIGALVVWRAVATPEALDTRFTGAYVLDDGTVIFIAPREGKVLRYRLMDGESSALWPVGELTYEAGPGWAERQPVIHTVTFTVDANGHADGLLWQRSGGPKQRARRLGLREELFRFASGELTLRGKLVTPTSTPSPTTWERAGVRASSPTTWERAGVRAHPAVVLVHGSDATSAVDGYYEPYLYAAHGIAALVFDKRGTGESQGEYTQNFSVLADDVIAAVTVLRSRTDIDQSRIHLAGFSQGGWIAPLAALRDGGIRSVLIGYGPMVSVMQEDRWGYVYALNHNGFGEDAVREVDRINEVIGAIIDRGENRWAELARMLDEVAGEPWFETVKGSDSAIGYTTSSPLPLWAVRLYAWWKIGRTRGEAPFIDRLYDPVPTVTALNAPSLWILGGEDSSMPTGWTVEKLDELQAAGRPIEYVLYPNAEHGILRFERGENGEHRMLGYEPEYLPLQIRWLRRHSGLE